MQKKKLVTVIITTYNIQRFELLQEAVQSVLNQTYGRENIRIIISVNGTDEQYKRKIESTYANINNIICIYTPKGNVPAALNHAIMQLTDGYMLIMNDNDYITDGYISELGSYVDNDIDIVFGRMSIMRSDGFIDYDTCINKALKAAGMGKRRISADEKALLGSHTGILLRVQTVKNTFISFDETLDFCYETVYMVDNFRYINSYIYILPSDGTDTYAVRETESNQCLLPKQSELYWLFSEKIKTIDKLTNIVFTAFNDEHLCIALYFLRITIKHACDYYAKLTAYEREQAQGCINACRSPFLEKTQFGFQLELVNLQNECDRLRQEVIDVRNNRSFKLGRWLTFIPRKIRGVMRCCRGRGIKEIIKLAKMKVEELENIRTINLHTSNIHYINMFLKFNRDYNKRGSISQKFLDEDDLLIEQLLLKMCSDARKSSLQATLYFNHALGGGSTAYLNKRIIEHSSKERSYVLEMQADARTVIVKDCQSNEEVALNIDTVSVKQFNYLLDTLKIDKLFVNQLVSYPVKKTIDLITNSGRDYTFFIHDYFAVCPQYTLLPNSLHTCVYNGQKSNWSAKCSQCKDIDYNIKEWRYVFNKLLSHAKLVVAPSGTAKQIVNDIYPAINIIVKRHKPLYKLEKTYQKEFLEGNVLTIGVIGVLQKQKGEEIVNDLARKIEKENLPIKIKVIGYTSLHYEHCLSKSGVLEITGRYDNKDVANLLAKYMIGIVLIPSICPETFSYTTEEALQSGYPVMAFNLGAPAERINDKNGWLIDDISADAVLSKLKEIVASNK